MYRRANVDRAIIEVEYDNFREHWQIQSDHVAPGGILAKTETKEDAVDEAVKVAKNVKPSKLKIWAKTGAKKTDTRMYG